MSESSEPLLRIDITKLIKFADQFSGVEVHLMVNGKYVKLNYSQDLFIDILRKLQQKEITQVWINQDDCKKVVAHVQHSLSAQTFYDPKTKQEDRVEKLNSTADILKSVINQIGVDQETVRLMKVINTRAMTLLSESPSIFSFVQQFKKNCSEEFLLSILTSFVMSMVIDKFPWKSDSVKEKASLAALMCDMILSKEDFKQMRDWERGQGELSEDIRKHPSIICDNLKRNRNLIPSETIIIIEQHHELPDGTGFPNGISGNKFNQLSSIFIICQQFIQQLHDCGYDYEKRFEIIESLRNKYHCSKSRTFVKTIDALASVVG